MPRRITDVLYGGWIGLVSMVALFLEGSPSLLNVDNLEEKEQLYFSWCGALCGWTEFNIFGAV